MRLAVLLLACATTWSFTAFRTAASAGSGGDLRIQEFTGFVSWKACDAQAQQMMQRTRWEMTALPCRELRVENGKKTP